jgi:hypothetical protein
LTFSDLCDGVSFAIIAPLHQYPTSALDLLINMLGHMIVMFAPLIIEVGQPLIIAFHAFGGSRTDTNL